LVQLGETLHSWSQEIATMWRFTCNNAITEGFHPAYSGDVDRAFRRDVDNDSGRCR
jgi:hypothetical protein